MSIWLGGLPYSSVGALQVRPRPAGGIAATYPRVGPQAVDPATECVFIEDAGSAMPAAARNVGGFCYTDDGALYVTTDTSTGPFTYIAGQKVRQDGAVCLISKTPTPGTDPYIRGAAFDAATGAQVINNLGFAFMATFADAGAGAVRTNLLFGTGPATFTRATTATTIGPTGLVVPVGTGVARSYYDPTSLAYLGYLAEGARTNLCLQSETFNTTWVVSNLTIGANAVASPDGTVTADRIIEDSASTQKSLNQGATTVTATPLTFSVFAKNNGRRYLVVRFNDNAANGNAVSAIFDLQTGVISGAATAYGTFTAPSATITAFPNGWYRCVVTGTSSVVTVNPKLQPSTGSVDVNGEAAIYLGDGASGHYVWGAQLEQAAFVSSYIPTTTVAVTRNADVLTYPVAGNIIDAAGTGYAEFTARANDTGNSRLIGFDVLANTVLNFSSVTTTQIFDSTNNIASTPDATMLNGAVHKAASSWGANLKITLSGVAPLSVAYDGTLIGANISIGSNGAVAGTFLNGTIKNVMIAQSQLSDAFLQSITL